MFLLRCLHIQKDLGSYLKLIQDQLVNLQIGLEVIYKNQLLIDI